MPFNKSALIKFARSATSRLAASYLAIIMIMSVGFSVVFYNTSSYEIGRKMPPPSTLFSQFDENRTLYVRYVDKRVVEARERLLANLLLLNILALAGGSYISYLLARRTLEPIEEAMEAQARFASDASHELRTPLASIQAENEVALRKDSLTIGRAKELLTSNVEEVKKLRELADGLLRLARQDNHALVTGPVSLAYVATEAINRVIKSAQAKHIEITDKVGDVKVLADGASLIQMLTILLDNAIKYSGEKQSIVITSSVKGRLAQIDVTDNGKGIHADDLPKIFDRFYRADSSRSSQNVSGYGLGLSIAYKIIKQHNGTVSVTSAPGHGSTFSVKLPLAPEHGAQTVEKQ